MIKKTISIIFFVFGFYTCYSQYTFQHIFKSPLFQKIGNIIEINNGDILFPIITVDPVVSKIMKINNEGEIIDSIIISNIPNCIFTLYKYNDDFFFACGYKLENSKYSFWLRKYDYNFQLLKELSFSISGYLYLYCNPIIVNKKNNIIISFSCDSTSNIEYANLLEINPNCEIIKYKKFMFYPMDYIWEIIQKDSIYYTFVGGLLHKAPFCVVYKLDSAFNILNVYNYSLPWSNTYLNNTKWLNDSIILLSGETDNYIPPHLEKTKKILEETKIIKIKVDTCLHTINDTLFTKNDSNNFIGWKKNLDFVDVNNIFLGSFATKDGGGYFSNYYSHLVLYKIDSAFHLKWEKEYGGDANYVLISIKATQDGGCVLAGTRYDYLTQNEETDPFIMKVNSEGNISWVHNLPDEFIKLKVYPNPGIDKLIVNNPPQNTKLILYDTNGQTQIMQSLNQSNRVNTTTLKSGIYYYQIVNSKGKVIGTGKWIKAEE